MSVALSTIRAQVRSYLDETTASDWTDVELNRLINIRYHRVYSAVVTVYEDYKISTDTFNTVADQQEYTSSDGLNTDILKIRRIELNYDISNSDSVFQRCAPIQNIDAIRTRLGETNSGLSVMRNPAYYYLGNTLGFLPIPDKSGTNAIKMWYIPTLSDLSGDSSTIDIPYPERYWNIIADGAASDALRFGQQDSTEADKFDQKYTAGVILMQEELEDRISEEAKGVIDVTGDNLDFDGGYGIGY